MERLQVMVVLGHRKRAVRLCIPVSLLYVAGGLLLVLLVAGGVFGRVMLSRSTDFGRMNRLTAENYTLKSRIVRYRAAMDTFQGFLASTEEMDNRLRAAAGLYLIATDVRKMGVGGGKDRGEDAGLDNLLRRTSFQQHSLAEIETALVDQGAKLNHIPSIWPVQGWVTSGFGQRRDPFTGRSTTHTGLDIVAPYGTRIVATADGRVTYAGWKSNWGRVVEVDHGNGLVTFYAHCQSTQVQPGDEVKRGQVIARLGSSGRSTGAHLHYGVERKGNWVNPSNYIVSK